GMARWSGIRRAGSRTNTPSVGCEAFGKTELSSSTRTFSQHRVGRLAGIASGLPVRRRPSSPPGRLEIRWPLPFPEPDRHRETTIAEGVGLRENGTYRVERVAGKEHHAVVDRSEVHVRPRRRAPGRRDPGIVQPELAADVATRRAVNVVVPRDPPLGDNGIAGVDVRGEEAIVVVDRELPLHLAQREPGDTERLSDPGKKPAQPFLEDAPHFFEARP